MARLGRAQIGCQSPNLDPEPLPRPQKATPARGGVRDAPASVRPHGNVTRSFLALPDRSRHAPSGQSDRRGRQRRPSPPFHAQIPKPPSKSGSDEMR